MLGEGKAYGAENPKGLTGHPLPTLSDLGRDSQTDPVGGSGAWQGGPLTGAEQDLAGPGTHWDPETTPSARRLHLLGTTPPARASVSIRNHSISKGICTCMIRHSFKKECGDPTTSPEADADLMVKYVPSQSTQSCWWILCRPAISDRLCMLYCLREAGGSEIGGGLERPLLLSGLPGGRYRHPNLTNPAVKLISPMVSERALGVINWDSESRVDAYPI